MKPLRIESALQQCFDIGNPFEAVDETEPGRHESDADRAAGADDVAEEVVAGFDGEDSVEFGGPVSCGLDLIDRRIRHARGADAAVGPRL